MTADLAIAKDLALPVDAVTQVLAFLGRRGSGKTYGSTKTAECMLGAGAQLVVLDPVGAWWGLRLAANGKDPGISIPIFGGLHGDIPLEPTAGALIADVVVDRGISAVLDVSQMLDTEQRRFAAAFAKQLFQRKKASPSAICIVLEECQEFVPQNVQNGEQQMLHEYKRMAKLGRNFGIGMMLISQRPQAVSKEVLNLTECMFAFQMTGPQERKAIAAYVSEKGADLDIVDELPRYAVGECHVWSPQWLQISKTIRFARKRTFDASSTPVVGAKAVATKALAPVDMEALRSQMADTIERAKSEDPAELRKQLAERDRKIRQLESAKSAVIVDQAAIARAVNVTRAEFRRELRRIGSGALDTLLASANKQAELVTHVAGQLRELDKFLVNEETAGDSRAEVQVGNTEKAKGTGANRPSATAMGRSTQAPARPIATTRPQQSDGSVSGTQQRILDAIAFYESVGNPEPSKIAVGGLAEINPKVSTWRGAMAPLRAAGYVLDVGSDRLALTDAGRAVARLVDIPSLADLQERWLAQLSGPGAAILRALLAVYPSTLTKAQLGDRVGIDPSVSTWRGHMAPLRKLGLVEDVTRDELRATALLFPEGLA